MMIKKKMFWFLSITLILGVSVLLFPYDRPFASETPVEDKVAILITSWGAPAGYNFDYAWNSHAECRRGDRTDPDDPHPCELEYHLGDLPFQSHLGLIPWALFWECGEWMPAWYCPPYLPQHFCNCAFWDTIYDNSGIYKLVGDFYVPMDPDLPSIPEGSIPQGIPITPVGELPDYPPDPRDGTDHLAGWFKIGPYFPNVTGDIYEQGPLTFIRYTKILNRPTEPPEAYLESHHVLEKMELTEEMLEKEFGDKIDVRFGVYNAIPPEDCPECEKHEADVAEDFANAGFTKMLLTRETTDNNNYANEFMTGNFVKERLCKIEEEMEIFHVRQVGRTPEFNAMNVINLKKYIEAYPEGSTISIIYVTRGLPWGICECSNFPMCTQHPWGKEVYHENAYLNYLSWKKALQKAYGDRYNLVFTKGGIDSDLRKDNFFTYGTEKENLGKYNPEDPNEVKFITIREAIQEAKADGIEDGNDKIIIASCHWLYDCLDNLQGNRELNGLPLQSNEELEEEIYHKTHCEDFDGNIYTLEDCGSEDVVAKITQAEAYSHLNEEFATSYYVVLRGGLERFGLFPKSSNIQVMASDDVTKEGGTVEVTDPKSNIKGAKIVIPEDPYPNQPEDFGCEEGDITPIPPNDPSDTNDCLWEDTVINIGYQSNAPDIEDNGDIRGLGMPVYFGPYRTIFNRDVTITLPVLKKPKKIENLNVYIYNDLTKKWEIIQASSVNYSNMMVTFKTQVLGVFQVGEAM